MPSIEELNDACFVVSDSAGQKFAYVYFEDEPGMRSPSLEHNHACTHDAFAT
jgi:hypothetical protein